MKRETTSSTPPARTEATTKPDAWRARLRAAVRAALPPLKALRTDQWENGRWPPSNKAAPQTNQTLQLLALQWHLEQESPWMGRRAGLWVFEGHAWIANNLVSFRGDFVRDLATGAFMQLRLETAGRLHENP